MQHRFHILLDAIDSTIHVICILLASMMLSHVCIILNTWVIYTYIFITSFLSILRFPNAFLKCVENFEYKALWLWKNILFSWMRHKFVQEEKFWTFSVPRISLNTLHWTDEKYTMNWNLILQFKRKIYSFYFTFSIIRYH